MAFSIGSSLPEDHSPAYFSASSISGPRNELPSYEGTLMFNKWYVTPTCTKCDSWPTGGTVSNNFWREAGSGCEWKFLKESVPLGTDQLMRFQYRAEVCCLFRDWPPYLRLGSDLPPPSLNYHLVTKYKWLLESINLEGN